MKLWSYVSASVFLALPIAAQNPRDSVAVNSNPTDDARGISVASDGSLSAILWNEGGSTNQVFVAVSGGAGVAWGMPVRVDADAFSKTSQEDSVFVAGSNVYAVWEANSGLFFSRSTDGGTSFSAPLPLDVGAGAVRDWRVAFSPDAAGDHIYVVSSTAIADEDLYLTSSHDDGATFSAGVLVPSVGSTGDVDALAVAADGNTVHIVWDDNRSGRDTVYYQRSTDGGATFLVSDVSLGDNIGVEDSQDPVRIAVSGSAVAVMWNEEPDGTGNEVIEVNVSTDGGTTFGGPVTVGDYDSMNDDTDAGDVGIDPTTGNVFVTWEDNRTGDDEAYVATSTDGGATFGSDVQLSFSGAQNPGIAVADAPDPFVIVYWESTTFVPTNRAESSLSTDGGLTFGGALVISDNTGFVDFPTARYGDEKKNFLHAYATLEGSVLRLRAGGFSVCGPAATATRNAGSNPASYSGTTAILGGNFTGTVDLSTTGHALAGLVGYASPLSLPLGGGQVVLVNVADPSGELLAQPLLPGPLAVFSATVPNDPALCELAISTQAIHVGGVTPFALSNAVDVTVAGLP